jgi:hypothetical protein
MHKIEKELLGATSYKSKLGTPYQDVLKGLVEAVKKLSAHDWNELSDPAQRWVKDVVTAIQNDNTIPGFSPEEDVGIEEEEQEDELRPQERRT